MKDLFKDLGLEEEKVTELTTAIESEIAKRVEGAKNDPELIKDIRTKESGKFFATMEKTLKKNLEIKPEDIPDDLSGLKKLESMLKVGIQSFEQNKDKTSQALQDELLKVTAEKTELEESIPALLEKENEKHYEKYINDAIFKEAADIECVVGPKAKVPLVNAFLNENGLKKVWHKDENDFDILRKADNLKFTVEGKALTKKEIIELSLEDVKKKSNGAPGGGTPPGTPPPPGGKGEHSQEAKEMAASFGVTI